MTHLIVESVQRTVVSTASGEIAISATGLGRSFGKHWAVKDFTLEIPKGAVYGFLGLNGAGKSTTIRMLMGLLTPTLGEASVLGLNPRTHDVEVKRRVGYVPDTPAFYEWMSVREMLAFVAYYRKGTWDHKRAEHLLKYFDLPREQKVETLSRGQRAKVSLLLALAFNPDVLLLDEPTLGLDPLARRQFVEGLLAEYMESDKTVLISSHLINEIAGIVDHVGILRKGNLVMNRRTDQLLAQVKRIRLIFDASPPAQETTEKLIRWTVEGREAVAIVNDFTQETVSALQSRYQPRQVLVEDLTLEEAFIEIAGRESES